SSLLAAGCPPVPYTTLFRSVFAQHRAELVIRTLLLIAMVLPIVLLSHDMATLLDDGLDRLGAPVALSGILIAVIVFLPETITTIDRKSTRLNSSHVKISYAV